MTTKTSKRRKVNLEEYRVEVRKGKRWNENPAYQYTYMECRKCGSMDTRVTESAVAVTCYTCVMAMVDPPAVKSKSKGSGKPRGWKFMKEFVDAEGNVYHKGVEQPKLKGTLPPTKVAHVKRKRKMTKREKEQARTDLLREYNTLKVQILKAKTKTRKKSIGSKMRKIEKQLNKL